MQAAAPQRKVLVLDCDNTLWGGVAGEGRGAGGAHLRLGEPFASLRALAASAARGGVPITLATRNESSDVDGVFEARGGELALGEVLIVEAGWGRKSDSVERICSRLGLPVDAAVLIDDSPVECGEVSCGAVGAGVVWLPPPWGGVEGEALGLQEEQRQLRLLDHCWALDGVLGGVEQRLWWRERREAASPASQQDDFKSAGHGAPMELSGTAEDASRTSLYKDHLLRAELREGATSFSSFLDALSIRITVEPLCAANLARAAQLTVRTNQMNALKAPFTETELNEQWLAGGGSRGQGGGGAWTVSVCDRFGSYGLVGLMALEVGSGGGAFEVPIFLLSCRVLCRGVEHAMLKFLGEAAARTWAPRPTPAPPLRVHWAPSPRNRPMRKFLWAIPEAVHVPAVPVEGPCSMADAAALAADAAAYLRQVLGEGAALPPLPVASPRAQKPVAKKPCKFGGKCERLGVDASHAAAFSHDFVFFQRKIEGVGGESGDPYALASSLRDQFSPHEAAQVYRARREKAVRARDRSFLGGLPRDVSSSNEDGPAPAPGALLVPLAAACIAALDAAAVREEEEKEGAVGGGVAGPLQGRSSASSVESLTRQGYAAPPHLALHFETLAAVAVLCSGEEGVWGGAEAMLGAARGEEAGGGGEGIAWGGGCIP